MGIRNIEGEDQPLSWEEFETSITGVTGEAETSDKVSRPRTLTDWVFRGHADSDWKLKTSLDRDAQNVKRFGDRIALKEYYDFADAIVPAVNSLTTYEIASVDFSKLEYKPGRTPPSYELLCFLRQLGFPSVLLDWTYSYYVAAFFAFRGSNPSKNVAIYAFQYLTGDGLSYSGNDVWINSCGPYVRSHPRQYMQRGTYTLCTFRDNDQIFLGSYEDAFAQNPRNHDIKKFIIAGEEKEKVLSKLFSMNINDYTLFGDDESLMRMLAYKELRQIP